MNQWLTIGGYRLADFLVESTLLMAAAAAILPWIAQPARRVAVGRGATIALAALVLLACVPGWPRVSWLPRAPSAELPRPAAAAEQAAAGPTSGAARTGPIAWSAAPDLPSHTASSVDALPKAEAVSPSDAVSVAASSPTAAEPAAPPVPRAAWPWIRLLAGAYLMAAGLVGLWLVCGALRTIGLCRRASPSPASLRQVLAQVVGCAGREPRLLLSPRLMNPVALGVARPTIVLPAWFGEETGPAGVRSALAHEWAHIRNGDLRLLALSRCLLPLLFVHPLCWWLQRRIRIDQEALADGAAAGAGGADRREYAQQLLAWARRAVEPAAVRAACVLGISEGRSHLSRRIAMLLDEGFRVEAGCSRRWRLRWLALLGGFAVALSVLTLQPGRSAEGGPAPQGSAAQAAALAPGNPPAASAEKKGAQPPAAAPAETRGALPPAPEKPLGEMIKEIEEQIRQSPSESERLRQEFEAAKAPGSPDYRAPKSSELELHVVGRYQGAPFTPEYGKAEVKVTHRSAPIILCLTSYHSVAWHVTLEPGVELRQVILGGYEPQKVVGLPKDAPIADYSSRQVDGRMGYARSKDRGDGGPREYLALANRLRELTDLEVSTFQGEGPRQGSPTVIGPESEAWRNERMFEGIRRVYQAATRPQREKRWAELRNLTFPALYREQVGREPHEVNTYYGEHTVAGPIQGKLRRIRGNPSVVAVDPRGPTFYTNTVEILDPETGQARNIDALDERGERRVGRACGLAFDTKRHRLVAVHLYGSGFMHAYWPDQQKWTPIRDMEQVDLSALCYSAKEDHLYGLAFNHGAGGTLYQYHPQGAILKKVTFQPVGQFGGRHLGSLQMAAAGDYLVVIAPVGGGPGLEGVGPADVAVIDPRSGEIVFVCRQSPPRSLQEQQQALHKELARAASPKKGHVAPLPVRRGNLPSAQAGSETSIPIAPVYNPANGHYYERVQNLAVTWEQAKAFAESRTYRGMRGYLATITSAAENEFLVLQWGERGSAWIGASDAEEEGTWKWCTGPEAGTVFWIGGTRGTAQGYHNWLRDANGSLSDPNNNQGKENYAVWNYGGHPGGEGRGQWADVAEDHTEGGILIEYSPDPAKENAPR